MATKTQSAPLPAHEIYIEPKQLPKLRSNYGSYVDSNTVGWMLPTPADTPIKEIRKRFENDGFVWMKGVIPRGDVLDMREHYFTHMSETGILKPDTSPRDGIFNPENDPIAHSGVGGTDLPEDKKKVEKLTSAHTTPIYLAFLQHPQLRCFIREFMGWKKDVMVQRTMLRHNVPHGLSTGIHYDRIFLRAGEAEFLTAWVPIGDCSATGGGLMYLENSTSLGKRMEAEFAAAAAMTPAERINGFNRNMARDGQLSHNADEMGRTVGAGKRWLAGDFEAGDVVFHNPYLIHGACKNEDEQGRIRLSTDLRFYEEGAALDERWMKFWTPDDGL
ncbi:hypothetical protein K432DRAFT_297285 [Lepidopterella palustris CBS 459.81]|uniref:Phytanoyl-CoA dioxygenase n=1 Tax=Lepidopterella palustris CBS 459.81 TaxID=1314670 RepID=A0A8E2EBC2_9PEZI|nr:hypothetical protein K432DRAFT_297285 [Lepidopterella palustris CBS 459.81]